MDPEDTGQLKSWAAADDPRGSDLVTECTESTEDISVISVTVTGQGSAAVRAAIERTLPLGENQRHHRLFGLARRLKAIPALADATPAQLRDVVKVWHQAALPNIATKEFEFTFWDFAESWGKVRYPADSQPVKEAFQLALADNPPKCPEHYENPKVRILVQLCRRLQQSAGEPPFFLACRTAGELPDEPYGVAARWLKGLVIDGVLEKIGNATGGGRHAYRYRYVR